MKTLQPSPTSEDEKLAEYEAGRKSGRVTALWEASGVRRRHAEQPAPAPGPWKDTLSSLLRGIGKGMLVALIGQRGTGKTQLAVECIRAACGLERAAFYTTAMDIFIALRDAYATKTSEQAVLARYYRPTLLVIDEVQERGETAWEDRMLTAIIDHRYSQLADTIVISNLKRAEFAASMGASVVSRMVEAGGIVECAWPSFRDRAAPVAAKEGT